MTVFLWDSSSWDDTPTSLDGLAGFTTKVTDGDHYYHNPTAAPKLNAMRGMGCPILGGYHVLWGNRSVPAQVAWFLQMLDADVPWWRGFPFFVAQSDNEPFYAGLQTPPSIDQINQFGDELVHQGQGSFEPTEHLPYAPAWHYGASIGGLRGLWWSSNYGANRVGHYPDVYAAAGGDRSAQWAAAGGKTPTILQFGSNTTIAGQTTSDANAFRGTLDQLKAALRPTQQPEGDTTMIRYQFDTTWPDRPADLGNRIINTDRMGMYDVEPFSTPQGGAPAVVVLSKATTADGKWSFATTFAAVTGGCAYGVQVADWRQAAAVTPPPAPPGGLTADEVRAVVRAELDATRLTGPPTTA